MSKHNITIVGVAITLGLIGLVVYYMAYEFTYQAKLEQEYSTTKKQLEQKQQEGSVKEQESQQLQERIKQLEADLQARNAEKVRIAALQQKTAQASSVKPTTASSNCDTLRSQLSRLGVSGAELNAAITLATRESSCRDGAVNASSGACGAFQSLPCGKWGAPGTDQYLRGAINYAKSRYGGFVAALNHSYAKGWY